MTFGIRHTDRCRLWHVSQRAGYLRVRSDVNLEGFSCHLVCVCVDAFAAAVGVVWKPRRWVDVLVERRVVRYTGSRNILLLCNTKYVFPMFPVFRMNLGSCKILSMFWVFVSVYKISLFFINCFFKINMINHVSVVIG